MSQTVHLLRNDGKRVAFSLQADGTVYEKRIGGWRRVRDPALMALVARKAVT